MQMHFTLDPELIAQILELLKNPPVVVIAVYLFRARTLNAYLRKKIKR